MRSGNGFLVGGCVETRALTLFQDGYKTPTSVEGDFQPELRL
jgi:hypothetical protein